MEGLNYHHLLYFREVAREGSIARAAEKLRVSQPTISEQIRTLEQQVGTALFARKGRRLEVTTAGRTALRYADDIQSLGQEMLGVLQGQTETALRKIAVGVAESVPPEFAVQFLRQFPKDSFTSSIQRRPSGALIEGATSGSLDIVLSDEEPSGAGTRVKQIATLPSMLAAPPSVTRQFRSGFPKTLKDAPLIAPASDTRLGRALESWLASRKVRPKVIAECVDAALAERLATEHNAVFVAVGEAPKGFMPIHRLERVTLPVYVVSTQRALDRFGFLRAAFAVKQA